MNFRVAMQLARSREMLNWFGSFYVLAAVGMITGFRRSAKPGVLVPLLPLTFVLGYQVDLAYGSKLNRIRGEKPAKHSIFLQCLNWQSWCIQGKLKTSSSLKVSCLSCLCTFQHCLRLTKGDKHNMTGSRCILLNHLHITSHKASYFSLMSDQLLVCHPLW